MKTGRYSLGASFRDQLLCLDFNFCIAQVYNLLLKICSQIFFIIQVFFLRFQRVNIMHVLYIISHPQKFGQHPKTKHLNNSVIKWMTQVE